MGLILLASFLFILWFFIGRKGGYGQPTILNLKKGEGPTSGAPIIQNDSFSSEKEMRDVTPPVEKIAKNPAAPPTPPSQCFFVYNGHDWDAYEVLGISPHSSFSEVTKIYQQQIKKVDPGKHEFLQTAYMAILKKF